MSDVDDALDISDLPRRELEAEIKAMFRDYSHNRPRSLQTALGPSEIGSLCKRQLAFGLTAGEMGKGSNTGGDIWRSYVGVALHKEDEEVLKFANDRAGEQLWIPEAKVYGHDKHPGSCDAYHVKRRTVVDWKHPGKYMFDKYRKDGPSWKYRAQVHIYGKGYARLGLPVEHVGIMFISPASDLHHGFLYLEPYSEEIANLALNNLDAIKAQCDELDVVHHPERFQQIPITPTDDCRLCNWWNPKPFGPRQCSGKE
ncbi:hypothetical protein ACFVUS_12640 [Nocardia sp. NPDC058058]|uniref:hypothetical protein n=1 Tax=Nocardia sp. NPDC058058 TaxID=3346317 RepID=UPI0036DB3D58